MPVVQYACTADAGENQNGSGFTSTQTFIDLLQHVNTSLARTGAWLFSIPDSIDVDAITNGTLEFVRANTTATNGDLTVESDAATLASGLTARWTAAEAENGSVAWNPSGGSTGAAASSADFGAVLKSALQNSTASGGYYTVAVMFKCDIGSPVSLRVASIEHATYAEAKLEITTSVPANFTATLPAISPTVTVGEAAHFQKDIDYSVASPLATDGYTRRKLDFHPATTGTGDRPTLIFVHGGAWTGGYKRFNDIDTNGLDRDFVVKLTSLGYNVASVEYRLLSPEIFYADVEYSFPQPIHDVRAALEYLYTNAVGLKIDTSKVVLGGPSAGGHLSMFAALSACTDDSAQYTGKQNSNGDRPAGYGLSDTASPWKFDFDENGELSSSLKPAGIMCWDSPIDCYEMTTIGGAAALTTEAARKMLFGVAGADPQPGSTYDELNINHYIDGTGATTYTSAINSGDIPPIFFVYSTAEDLVLNSASIEALEDALDTVGYDTSTGEGVLNTSGGLTKVATASIHGNALVDQGPDYDDEVGWLAEILSGSDVGISGDTTVTTSVEGVLVADRSLGGDVSVTSAVSGTLIVDRSLSGDVSVTASASGDLVADRALSGDVSVACSASGTLIADRALTGSTGAALSASGDLVVDRALSGAVVASVSVTGDIDLDLQLSGGVSVATDISGDLVADRALSGVTGTSTTVSGDLVVDRALSGSVAVTTGLSGSLSTDSSIGGDVSVTTAVSGDITADRALSGSIAVSTSVSGEASIAPMLTGAIAAAVLLEGSLTRDRPLSGDVAITTAVSGDITTDLSLTGDTSLGVSITGDITVDRALSGTVSSTISVSGDLTVSGIVSLSGEINSSILVTGELISDGSVELEIIGLVDGFWKKWKGSLVVPKLNSIPRDLIKIRSVSVEAVQAAVVSTEDPTSNTVEFAFPAEDAEPSTWTAGSWDGSAASIEGTRYYTVAEIIIGTGGDIALTDGKYDVYVRIDAGSETPVLHCGQLRVL